MNYKLTDPIILTNLKHKKHEEISHHDQTVQNCGQKGKYFKSREKKGLLSTEEQDKDNGRFLVGHDIREK